jgi:hypothetical protein
MWDGRLLSDEGFGDTVGASRVQAAARTIKRPVSASVLIGSGQSV